MLFMIATKRLFQFLFRHLNSRLAFDESRTASNGVPQIFGIAKWVPTEGRWNDSSFFIHTWFQLDQPKFWLCLRRPIFLKFTSPLSQLLQNRVSFACTTLA